MAAVISAILRDAPPPVRSLRPDAPPELERVVLRCLQKDRANRYPTASEIVPDLEACAERLFARRAGIGRTLRTRRVAIFAALFILALGAVVVPRLQRATRARWAKEEAMPEIARLTEAGDYYGAFQLAREAERALPGDPRLRRMLESVTLPIPIATRPAGAEVLVKRYASPEAAWESLGKTPIPDARVPYAIMRWKITKPGFEAIEAAPFGEQPFGELAGGLVLEPEGTRPPGMVRVPGGFYRLRELPPVTLGDFWLDQYEVTNKQFKEFVDHGGYETPAHWPPIVEEGRAIAWSEAAGRFRDTTGRPGPASWEVGSYPEGRAEFPVSGVSWYEASAYCAFAHKTLPTVYHWYKAAAQRQVSDILGLSNLGTKRPARVGSHQGLGAYGTYDMAGNVKEWAWNETGGKRYALGGAWNEPAYMYQSLDALPPLERSPSIGLRCARAVHPLEAALLAPMNLAVTPDRPPPATDAAFEAWRGIYAYSRSELRARVDAVDDSSPHWRKETVSYNAAYGGERITAFVFVPRGATPPYQAVLWVPGGEAFLFPSSQSLTSPFLYDFLPRSGRLLVYPVYKGTYERRIPFSTASEWRDLMIQWSKDIGRTLDYLEARKDVDMGRVGYYGLSSGARDGPIFMSIDRRFKAGVLLGGGLDGEDWELLPEVNAFNFAPRCRVPILMINGRDDFLMPVEPTQRLFFRLLGAPEGQKRHALLAGGHLPSDLLGIVRETLAWFDRQLGPVSAPAAAGGQTARGDAGEVAGCRSAGRSEAGGEPPAYGGQPAEIGSTHTCSVPSHHHAGAAPSTMNLGMIGQGRHLAR
jgi:formylglycine-generating enzyme required for sulfatase activity/dienelactone hydrolase